MDKYKICCNMEAGRSSWDSKCGLLQRLRLNSGLKKQGITHILFIVVLLAYAATISVGQTPTEAPRFTFQLLPAPVTWSVAGTECINMGTQVARIIDNETQAALETFLQEEGITGEHVWIGARIEDSVTLLNNPVPVWRSFPLDTERLSMAEVLTDHAALFQGCFSDVTTNRDLGNLIEEARIGSDNMTPGSCIRECASDGFLYAGVQVAQGDAGQECYCGDRFGIHEATDNCARPCTGDNSQTCGGFGHNQVYRVDGSSVNWLTSPMNPTNADDSPVTECGVYDLGTERIMSLSCTAAANVRYLCHLDLSYCFGSPSPPFYQFTSAERGDICVYHSEAGTETGSWFYGRHECMNLGGDLLVLYTDQEFQALQDAIDGTNVFDPNRFAYIGLIRRSYYWPEASGLKEGIPMEYNNFGNTEPDMERDCVYINSDTGTWATADCDDLKQAICLLEPISNIETSTSTNQPTTPDPPVAAGGAIYAAYALIGVLVVLLIVMVILALIRAKQKKNKVGAEPEAADCRDNASKPEGGHLGSSLFHDIDEYESNSQYSTGSRRNLLTGSAYDLSASTVPGIAAGGPMMGKEEMSKINLD